MVEVIDSHVRSAADFGHRLAAGKVGVPAIAPRIQVVAIGRKGDGLQCGVGHCNDELFASFYALLADSVLDLSPPFPHHDTAFALLIDRKPIVTFFLDLHAGAGQVHEVAAGMVHAQNQFTELHFDIAVPSGYVSEDHIGIRTEPQEVPLTQLDFDAGIHLRNNSITTQERKVDGHFRPVDIARRLVARLAVNEADSGRVITLPHYRACRQQGNRCEPKQS